MFTLLLYAAAAVGLIFSFRKNNQKTRMALKKAWKSFEIILPQFLCIIIIITGISLACLDAATISRLLGGDSGILGMAIAAVVGAIAFIPAFVLDKTTPQFQRDQLYNMARARGTEHQ